MLTILLPFIIAALIALSLLSYTSQKRRIKAAHHRAARLKRHRQLMEQLQKGNSGSIFD